MPKTTTKRKRNPARNDAVLQEAVEVVTQWLDFNGHPDLAQRVAVVTMTKAERKFYDSIAPALQRVARVRGYAK